MRLHNGEYNHCHPHARPPIIIIVERCPCGFASGVGVGGRLSKPLDND